MYILPWTYVTLITENVSPSVRPSFQYVDGNRSFKQSGMYFEANLSTNTSSPISEQHTERQEFKMNENIFKSWSNENVWGLLPESVPELDLLQPLNLAIWHSILRTI